MYAGAGPAKVVRPAALEGRRAVLGSLLAGVAALSLAGTPRAQAVELEDYRKARETGFDLIYEARDLNLTQAERDGLTQARTDLGATRKRLQQSEKSIDKDLEQWIRKNYWTEAREQLRRQVGTLRFDVRAVAESLPKAEKKEAFAAGKQFLKQTEALDLALRKKDETKALGLLDSTKSALDTVLAKLG
ncbi:Oxygen-evolving enhancer protein 3, chloroplastic [Auxenochlorella protothecoides]|uniref:Oxygen-evolving enhancer protein 3, chloroplastic n=1 Tax=Auxenochlorella protothecoides TaxID=3075 RepID=A0A087SP25_AUXPR|nr:Oxygen-evolving enhancer protein 3, chloroplastic [Auxenochlorella protothecoides]KFM27479.1 Oxygen-evolving enhancer protein 3, chloroplastic [Auxenochlorella protothecoides]RMZ54606.1 hypothetical protein APUTEX25_002192 [Auxenochlorella protothecoides]|eukprot:RMZ54606.1 hypothetical protein APUTEX25_002192 [Auxenochlorella protothecoides]